MSDDYAELFLKWSPGAATQTVRRWVEEHGLTAMTMKSGLLLSGSREQIEKAFSVSMKGVEPPMNLPIPAELREHVESISYPKPRSYHT